MNKIFGSIISSRFILHLIIFTMQTAVANTENPVLKGTVKDAVNASPLVGANIVVQGTFYGASSNTNGEFSISGLAPGEYTIKASMMGYKSKVKSIAVNIGSAATVEFRLEPTVLKMESVTVIAKTERNPISNPQLESAGLELSTSMITQREIKRHGAKTLINAMKYIPGAWVETRGRKVKQFFSIRGQIYPYPEYAINGAWQREFHETPYFFTTSDIERIEVIRSSAALLTGLSGMTGVINIVTKDYETAETSQEIEYGTFGTFRGHLYHGSKAGNITYATGLGVQHTDGPDGKHAAEGMTNFYSSLRWRPSNKVDIRTNLFHINGKRELALAEPPAAKRFQTELWSFDPFRSTLMNLKMFYRPSPNTSTEFLLYYSDRDPVLLSEDFNTHEITRTSEKDHEWGAQLIQSLSLSTTNVLRISGLYNHWVAPNGKRFYVGRRCDLETFSLTVVDEQRFGQLNVDAGLKWVKTFINEYGAFNLNGSGKKFTTVTPVQDEWEPSILQGSFGAAYDFPWFLSSHLNFAAGDIQPRRGTLDTNLQEPKNERRLKLDVGFRTLWEGISQLSLVGFMMQQKNAIVLSGKTSELQDSVMELYLNRDQHQWGLEFETRFGCLFNTAEAFFNATVMSSKAEANGEMKRNKEIPNVICSGGVYTQTGCFDLNIMGKYISSYESTRFVADSKDNPAKPQSLGDFFALDLTTGWTFGKIYVTRLYLEIQNVTDKKYSTVVGYPDFGRRITMGVRHNISLLRRAW